MSAQLEVLRMRRFVLFLFPTVIALVTAGLLVAARRSETLKTRIDRIKDGGWLTSLRSSWREVAEVPS